MPPIWHNQKFMPDLKKSSHLHTSKAILKYIITRLIQKNDLLSHFFISISIFWI